jgi:phenylpyruvate tautomerase PptA (4-oxalocrotonate tautomerase family)
MPYLQIEVIRNYPVETKRLLAKAIGAAYSRIMQASPDRITVVIRELGEGAIWRCSAEDPAPGAIMMCDIRIGRTKDTREALSKKLVEICNEVLALEVNQLNIEFTQHTGDEMYHQWMGRLSNDWSETEDRNPLL